MSEQVLFGAVSLIVQGVFTLMMYLFQRNAKQERTLNQTWQTNLTTKMEEMKTDIQLVHISLDSYKDKVAELDKKFSVAEASYVSKDACSNYRLDSCKARNSH